MIQPIRHRAEALAIIAAACGTYPDSRNLARHHAEMLQECGHEEQALAACEAFVVRFGAEDGMISLARKLRQHIGVYDRLDSAGPESLSLCMIVKDEQSCLARCLASVKPVVHEMIVVDTGSTDRTVDIAEAFGAKVSTFLWNGNFSDARNHAIEQAAGNWILLLDADEVLSAGDYDAIRQSVREANGKNIAWSVVTRNYTNKINAQGWTANDNRYPAEQAADGWHPSTKVRLFPNRTSIRFCGEVHEMVEKSLRQSGFELRNAPFVVHHYGELADDLKSFDKQLNYLETGMKKLEQNPGDLAATAEVAVQAGELGQFELAISLWDRVLCRVPDAAEALFNKGYCLIGLKRYEEALSVSRKALERDPDHKEAAFNYGTCELYVGDPHKALKTIAPIAEKHPDYPLLQALMAVLFLSCGRGDEGRKIMRTLDARGYDIGSYISERIAVLEKTGRNELANRLRAESGGSI